MIVYRITLPRFSDKLRASGNPARWCSRGIFMIYTASSRALACLENVVHRNSDDLTNIFKTLVIEIPNNLIIKDLDVKLLSEKWYEGNHYAECQTLGDVWIMNMDSCILRVPSAIIKNEFNYLINPQHPDFLKMKIIEVEDFIFDSRIKK
jgi:RES domain-containing protein